MLFSRFFPLLAIPCWVMAEDLPAAQAAPADSVQADTVLELPGAVTHGRRAVTPSNSQVIRDRDLSLRPMLDPADVIKVTPGLYVGQHAGGGKANQYFIRGFDIDHGTDLALWYDGMPINNVSHGHGQGSAIRWRTRHSLRSSRRQTRNQRPNLLTAGHF
jgi:outer membrane receptor for Fe3+-dicitrate